MGEFTDSSGRHSSIRSFNNGLSPLDLLSARGRHLAERIGLEQSSSVSSSDGSSRRLSDVSVISGDDVWDRRLSMLSTDSDISSILHPDAFMVEKKQQDELEREKEKEKDSPIKPRGSSLVTGGVPPIPNFSRPSSYISGGASVKSPGLPPMEKLSVCDSPERLRGRRQVSSNARLQTLATATQPPPGSQHRSRSASPISKKYLHLQPPRHQQQQQQQQQHARQQMPRGGYSNSRGGYHRSGSSLQIDNNIPTSQVVLDATLYDGMEHGHQYPCISPRQVSFIPKPRTSPISPTMPPVAFSVPAIKRRIMEDLTGEELLSKGIQLHEEDDLAGSTYYFQCAAQKGEPAGMILYGLALRHGWGVRPNAKHGIMWLDKAIRVLLLGGGGENSKQERLLSYDEMVEKIIKLDMSKEKKAKVGLALYELGVSYIKSMGVEKDEKTGLLCFELAASLGDVDGLMEAAQLYMRNGGGWKRDMNRAARYYRMAAEKGVCIVGNTWIYKDKYMNNNKQRSGWFS